MSLYLGKEKINNISVGAFASSGIDTSDATATADDMAAGKTAYVNGEKITGNLAKLNFSLPTPNVSETGEVSLSMYTSGGIITSGKYSSTKQLPTTSATTITPSTYNKTAVSKGYYTTGNIIVKGDANLVSSNIKNGASIFGVTGTYEGSGSSSTPSTYLTIGTFEIIDEYQGNVYWTVPSFAKAYNRIEIFPIGNTFINDDSSLAINEENIQTLMENTFNQTYLRIILNFSYFKDNYSSQNSPLAAITYYEGPETTVKFSTENVLDTSVFFDPEAGTFGSVTVNNTLLLGQLFPDTIQYGVLYHN